MKSLQEYIDMLPTETGSDYAKAKKLGVSQTAIYKINHGGSIKDKTAVRLAKLIEIDEEEVLLAAMIARTKDLEVKIVLEKISKNLGIAASVYLAIGQISPSLETNLKGAAYIVNCILC